MKILFVGGHFHGRVLDLERRDRYKVPVPSTEPMTSSSIQVYERKSYFLASGGVEIYVLEGGVDTILLIDALVRAAGLEIHPRND